MNHKTITLVALLMVAVFGGMILLYPMLFNPQDVGLEDGPPAPPAAAAPSTAPTAPVTQ